MSPKDGVLRNVVAARYVQSTSGDTVVWDNGIYIFTNHKYFN